MLPNNPTHPLPLTTTTRISSRIWGPGMPEWRTAFRMLSGLLPADKRAAATIYRDSLRPEMEFIVVSLTIFPAPPFGLLMRFSFSFFLFFFSPSSHPLWRRRMTLGTLMVSRGSDASAIFPGRTSGWNNRFSGRGHGGRRGAGLGTSIHVSSASGEGGVASGRTQSAGREEKRLFTSSRSAIYLPAVVSLLGSFSLSRFFFFFKGKGEKRRQSAKFSRMLVRQSARVNGWAAYFPGTLKNWMFPSQVFVWLVLFIILWFLKESFFFFFFFFLLHATFHSFTTIVQ